MGITIVMHLPRQKPLKIMSLPFIYYKLNEYELINSNNLFILGVTGSALLLIICVRAK